MKPLSLANVRSALVVAPHPDDETIGAYGLMRLLSRRAAQVHVLIVTDGAASHPASRLCPPDRLIVRRRRETLAAMADIGISARAVRFLGLPDGELATCAAADRARLVRALAHAGDYDLLVTPARDDDHPDHRMVACMTSGARAARRLEYLVWPNREVLARPATHYLRLGIAAPAKRGAIRRYRSQFGAIRDDPDGFAISRSELAAFAGPVELFREIVR